MHEVDPLECLHCGATLRIVALIDDANVIEQILRHLDRWNPTPEALASSGPDPPLPKARLCR